MGSGRLRIEGLATCPGDKVLIFGFNVRRLPIMETDDKEKKPPAADEVRLRDTIEALEAIVRDRALLNGLNAEERQRLLTAAGDVYCPDVNQRRRQVKERQRQRKQKIPWMTVTRHFAAPFMHLSLSPFSARPLSRSEW